MTLFKKKVPEPLRACAFCGGTPKLCSCGDQKEYNVYMCSSCFETPVHYDEARVCESAAKAIWNQRTEEAEYIIRIYNHVVSTKT